MNVAYFVDEIVDKGVISYFPRWKLIDLDWGARLGSEKQAPAHGDTYNKRDHVPEALTSELTWDTRCDLTQAQENLIAFLARLHYAECRHRSAYHTKTLRDFWVSARRKYYKKA